MPTVNPLKLKTLRKLKKLGQKDVAEHLGNMKPGTYSAKENKGDFTEKEIALLAKLFKVDKSEFIIQANNNDRSINSSELAQQVRVIAKIQKVEFELLLSLYREQQKDGYNKSSEILKRYGLEDIFDKMDNHST